MMFTNYDYGESPEKQKIQIITKMSWQYWRFRKARESFRCVSCDTIQMPGMRYIGDSYCKICMKCAPTYMKNTIEGFKTWFKTINKNVKIYNKNEAQWIKEAMAGALANQNSN